MSSIEFRVLGRLEVHTEGGTIALGSAKQRSLLAALLLHPGRTVPIRRLIQTLWGDEPPLSAVANLRTYANRLRGVLPGERISGRASGYEIQLCQGELDLHVFAERAGTGRAAFARGDHSAAVRHLGAALSACRGAVLEDLADNEALAGSIAPVEELRLSVAEDHLDARLRLGEHREVIAPLREFVAEHPLRERPWAHLMTALYRSGDPAGALAVYTDCRRVLADRLGLEPSPDLARLHRAVLDRDPGLTAVSPVAVTAGQARTSETAVPQELPVRCRSFAGRAGVVARLTSLLVGTEQSGPKAAVVHGPCGIGKTALVLEVAHRVGARFPGGQLYVDLSVDGPASRVPPRLLRHLGVATSDIPWTPDEAAAVLRSQLAHRAVLLVLDGATESAALRPLIPARGPCAVLITSRSPLMLDGAEHVALGRLSDEDGLAVLAGLAGRAKVDADPGAAAEIVRHCHGIPAALRIAGTILANRPTRPLSWLAHRLAPEESRLDELGFGGESLRALYSSAFRPIAAGEDPLAAAAFRLLGRPGFEVCRTDQAAAILDACPMKAEAALDRLVDLGLAEWGEEDTYRLPPLMRLFSAELGALVPAQRTALSW
ncbi:BTAD domain-containing putative transcriptional regulator [Amycolatopsis sp. QT-25]|uniref:AfsR/SARP family transcriptional regulator n=1 Tax=Amycolatopsis sp. QT-25 TaxID=3034022 RepID=UPI0023EC71F8|nr:AfsR/SARP family transcriptional regulator [Amycolatopsis sp. QT-25]WET76453.1 BTAD domain-containing putative transcriptional regulator [Amycolatopsis sp. QT-25]